MNTKVREYLIEVAREGGITVYYSELIRDNSLKIKLNSEEGQAQLRQLLTEISTYEHKQERPMLTALAINKVRNDQGSGFYDLAESFGYGKKSKLTKSNWGKQEAERVRKFWQNENNYNQYAKTEVQGKQPNSVATLFKKLTHSEDYQWAKNDWWGHYINFTNDLKKLQQALTENPQFNIDNKKLYRTLSEPIQSYETFMLKWLKEKANGISSRGQSTLSGENFKTIIEDVTFKTIAKLIISNPNKKNYKLLEDWWTSNDEISNHPLLVNRAFAACLPEKLSSTVDNKKFWFVVDVFNKKYGFQLDQKLDWNWFTANVELTAWLDVQLKTVIGSVANDRLEQQIWRNIFVWLVYDRFYGKQPIPENTLVRRDPPEDGYDQMPPSKASFEGRDVDFERLAKEQKELGDAGEALVMQYEIKELEKRGMGQKAKLVRIAKPGEGFDVYSFDEKGIEKFIEVKTTTGDWKNRFYLTRHEIQFMEENKTRYSLYRVYNFDEEHNSGEFFEFREDIANRTIKEPTVFEVVIRKRQ